MYITKMIHKVYYGAKIKFFYNKTFVVNPEIIKNPNDIYKIVNISNPYFIPFSVELFLNGFDFTPINVLKFAKKVNMKPKRVYEIFSLLEKDNFLVQVGRDNETL